MSTNRKQILSPRILLFSVLYSTLFSFILMSNSILIERSHFVTSCALFRSNLLINTYVLSFSDLSVSHYFMSSVTGQIDTVYQVDKIPILSIIHSIYERWRIGSRSTASALLVFGCIPLFSSTDRPMLKEPSHHVYFLGPTPSVSFHSQEQPAVCGYFFFSRLHLSILPPSFFSTVAR